jgi:Ca-activated chloride channel family protein
VIPEEPAPPPPEKPPEEERPPAPGTRLEEVEKDAVRVALLLVIDTSGSMRGEKLYMARVAAWQTAQTLDGQDRIGVLGFADDPYWIVRPTLASHRKKIGEGLNGAVAAGGTDIYRALRQAFQAIGAMDVAVRHVILLSDGHTPMAPFSRLLADARARKITLSTVGIGQDFDMQLLGLLAKQSAGAFEWARTPDEIPALVTEDAKRILRETRGEPLAPGTGTEKPEPEPEKPPVPTPEPAEDPEPELAKLRVAAPHPALAGIEEESVPDLGEIAVAKARAAAWVALETVEDARPVLAEWRVGNGRVLVLATNLEGPGAERWRAWEDHPKLLAQAVRALAATSGRSAPPEMEIRWEPHAVVVRIPDAREGTRLRVLDGDEATDLELVPTGDGAVETRLPRDETGRQLLLEASRDDGRRARPVEIPPASAPEDRAFGTDDRRLREIAEAAGGRFAPDPRAAPASPERPVREPLGLWPLLAAAALLPLDVALRRLGRTEPSSGGAER